MKHIADIGVVFRALNESIIPVNKLETLIQNKQMLRLSPISYWPARIKFKGCHNKKKIILNIIDPYHVQKNCQTKSYPKRKLYV